MADQLGSDQKQLEANLALLQLDGVDVDVLRNMIVGTPSREGELGVEDGSQTGDFSGMSFISNGSEVAVTGGKADVSGISGEISLQGYQYGSAIPDSVLYQFRREDITASDGATSWTWPEREQDDDMAVNGAAYDVSLFGGEGGASSDGSNDYGTTSTMGSFGSNLGTDWSLALRVSTTDTGTLLGTTLSGGTGYLLVKNDGTGSAPLGNLMVDIRDTNSNNLRTWADTAIDDGGDYTVIINKVGNSTGGVEYYFDPSTAETNTGTDQGISSFADFSDPMHYFAQWDGSVEGYLQADWGGFLWFTDSLNQSERENVFSILG